MVFFWDGGSTRKKRNIENTCLRKSNTATITLGFARFNYNETKSASMEMGTNG
jgi:hypothetical protein